MRFEILHYRNKYSAVTRESPDGVIRWYSQNFSTEAEVRAAIKALAETDWSKLEIVLSRY